MRQAFINTLIQLADTDHDLYLLTADMGFGLVEPFATKFPKQYINVGVAEQNMIGVAAGLALEGKKVFCYSIANFPTMRCLEQIRNDVCYHNLPVCIVSGGTGLWYGELGMSHWALEDIAVMRCLPNMAVVCPCDAKEMGKAMEAIYQRGSPCYLRMSRTADIPIEPLSPYVFVEPRRMVNRTLPDVVILATGGQMIANACLSAEALLAENTVASVFNMHTVKPLGWWAILSMSVEAIITIEEHSKIGGLGSAVAEVLAGLRQHPPLIRMGTDDGYLDTAMSYEELLKFHHLTVEDIVEEVLDALS